MSSPDVAPGTGSANSSPQMVTSTTGGPLSAPSQMQQQHQLLLQQQQQQQKAHDASSDSVTRAKALLVPLKASLEALIRNASQNLHQNASLDLGVL